MEREALASYQVRAPGMASRQLPLDPDNWIANSGQVKELISAIEARPQNHPARAMLPGLQRAMSVGNKAFEAEYGTKQQILGGIDKAIERGGSSMLGKDYAPPQKIDWVKATSRQ